MTSHATSTVWATGEGEAVVGSTFSWLAYDDGEAEQMRQVVEAFGEKRTLDPIGFGPIRDGVADLLFPGISTIQTRARYFLFVPRIFQALEAVRVPPGEIADRRRQAEIALIEALLAGEREADAPPYDPDWLGIIGRNVGHRVRTTPATIYWHGLRTFRIRRFSGASGSYVRHVAAAYRAGSGPMLDEDGNPVEDAIELWDPAVPGAGQMPARVETFELSLEESDYLTERIQHTCPGSVLTAMLQFPDALANAAAPWDVPPTTPELRSRLRDGQLFAVVIHGLQLLYNRLLLDRAAAELDLGAEIDGHDRVDEMMRDWVDDVAGLDTTPNEATARFDGLVNHLRRTGHRVPTDATRFFRDWIGDAAQQPEEALERQRHAEAVRVRERQLKGGLAKLTSRAALEAWAHRGELQAVGRLDYRWSNAQRIVSDIVAPRQGVA